MIKVAITGAAGRMGRALVKAVTASAEFLLTHCFESPNSGYIGRDAGICAGIGEIGIPLEGTLKEGEFQVIIDFTAPQASVDIAKFASENRKPLVIGTTGFEKEQLDKIKSYLNRIPCLLSPNMSVGINLLYYLVEESAKILGIDYDCEIVESHHSRKKDAPSGTANKIKEIIARIYNEPTDASIRYGRSGRNLERHKGEIGLHSIRAGDIVGEHKVIFAGSNEVIELAHKASSRDTFVEGALKAAKYIVGAPPGLYTMADVLKLPKV